MVKRFEVDECGGFYEDPTGDYMLHEDYEKLRDAARKALKSLHKFGGQTPLPERYGQTALAELEELLKC